MKWLQLVDRALYYISLLFMFRLDRDLQLSVKHTLSPLIGPCFTGISVKSRSHQIDMKGAPRRDRSNVTNVTVNSPFALNVDSCRLGSQL